MCMCKKYFSPSGIALNVSYTLLHEELSQNFCSTVRNASCLLAVSVNSTTVVGDGSLSHIVHSMLFTSIPKILGNVKGT